MIENEQQTVYELGSKFDLLSLDVDTRILKLEHFYKNNKSALMRLKSLRKQSKDSYKLLAKSINENLESLNELKTVLEDELKRCENT